MMSAQPRRAGIKSVVLPTEHGAWGFLLEPIVLALLVSPTLAGAAWAVAVIAAFLSRHPLKLWLRYRNNTAHARRRRIATAALLTYGALAAAGFALAILLAGWKPGAPIVLLSPFTAIFLFYDSKKRARDLLPEFAGPLGLAATAPTIALAGGWSWAAASALWVLLVARTLPSIVYVRARLRLERGENTDRTIVAGYHIAFAAIIALLVWRGLSPVPALVAFGVLAMRAILGLSRYRRFKRARQVGVMEIIFGFLYVFLVAIGYLSAG